MSSFLIFTSIHLGIELLGAAVFFMIAWIFFEAYLLKRDVWSGGRSLGFLLLSFSQVLRGVSSGSESARYLSVVTVGLLLIFVSYAFEKLPPKPRTHPKGRLGAVIIPPTFLSLGTLSLLTPWLWFAAAAALMKRYLKDIDKLLKWLVVGFVFLAGASFLGEWSSEIVINRFWVTAYLFKLVGFIAVGAWVWQWLSLRLREELLVVFVGAALVIALLVTTVFSFVLTQGMFRETENKLRANAQILNFYIEGLTSKALSASQIIARDEDFISAAADRDAGDLARIGRDLMARAGGEFLTVATKNGDVFFKINAPNTEKENVLAEWVGAEALEGRPAATIEESASEGFSVRAAAPLLYRGEIIGAVVTGVLLDNRFAEEFRTVSKLETTIFTGNKIAASTFFERGNAGAMLPKQEFVGRVSIQGKDIVGAFVPVLNVQGEPVGTIMMTTTPREVLLSSQRIERMTLLIILIVVLALTIPLYRLTIFLTA